MIKEKESKEKKKTQEKKSDDNKKMVEEISFLKETLQRLQAEFENYKKRVEREKEELTRFASRSVITDLLPIIDHFELALKNKSHNDEFTKGIELIYAELMSLLEQYKVKKIDGDTEFDPNIHEAMMQELTDKENDNKILEVFQCGYTMDGKVIRHSKVKVGKYEHKDEQNKDNKKHSAKRD